MLEKKISRRNMLRTTGLAVLGSTSQAGFLRSEEKRGAHHPKHPLRNVLSVSVSMSLR